MLGAAITGRRCEHRRRSQPIFAAAIPIANTKRFLFKGEIFISSPIRGSGNQMMNESSIKPPTAVTPNPFPEDLNTSQKKKNYGEGKLGLSVARARSLLLPTPAFEQGPWCSTAEAQRHWRYRSSETEHLDFENEGLSRRDLTGRCLPVGGGLDSAQRECRPSTTTRERPGGRGRRQRRGSDAGQQTRVASGAYSGPRVFQREGGSQDRPRLLAQLRHGSFAPWSRAVRWWAARRDRVALKLRSPVVMSVLKLTRIAV